MLFRLDDGFAGNRQLHAVDAGAGADVKGFVIRAAPGYVGYALRDEQRGEVLAFGRENDDAAGTCAVDVSLDIDLHAIGAAGTRIAGSVIKQRGVGERAVGEHAVAHPDFLWLSGVDVEEFFAGRKSNSVRPGQIGDKKLEVIARGRRAGLLGGGSRDAVDAVDLELFFGV